MGGGHQALPPLRWALVIAGGLVAVALVSYLLQPERVESALTQKRTWPGSNIDQRLVAWRVALEQFRSSPVLGVGPGTPRSGSTNSNSLLDPELGALAAHNAYLDVLAELGGPGLCLFLAYLGLAWSRLRRRAPGDPVADGLQSALAAGFVVAMVGALFLTEQYYSPLWLLPAVGALLVRDRPARRAAVERGREARAAVDGPAWACLPCLTVRPWPCSATTASTTTAACWP